MSNKEIKLLTRLAQKLQSEKLTNEKVLSSFVSAGIFTKQGNFTKPYNNLKNIVTSN
jgi:hypothetical protein